VVNAANIQELPATLRHLADLLENGTIKHHQGYLTIYPVVLVRPVPRVPTSIGLKIVSSLVLRENTENGNEPDTHLTPP
jgi:hypothetical protein